MNQCLYAKNQRQRYFQNEIFIICFYLFNVKQIFTTLKADDVNIRMLQVPYHNLSTQFLLIMQQQFNMKRI
ncbi:unnamed protein product [Paramecium octaurelia]|uniref:Uncharacterized protein n=1 Tax=Paramecium octaurelia TaxID=43137 RepID=A0A8S1XRT2_PAROT|nr:unnamed protein product [Paramecium octaurelia]